MSEEGDNEFVTLFVGNLPYSAHEQDILDLFGKYNASNIRLIKFGSGNCRGFGFVDLPSYDIACKALEEMNGVCISGRRLRIEFSKEDNTGGDDDEDSDGESENKTLFVGNIPFSATEQNLYDLFGKFNASNITIKKHGNGYSRGFGYVELPSYLDACRALDQMKGVCISGRELRIEFAHSENNNTRSESGNDEDSEGEHEDESDDSSADDDSDNSGDEDDLDDGDDTDDDYHWHYRHGFYGHYDPNVEPSWRNVKRFGYYGESDDGR